MNKTILRQKVFRLIEGFGENIRTKFTNICSKTGSYSVPLELFQKRTSRKNRVLISWKQVKENKLTIEQLNTFEGGVVVEFVNNDYFLNIKDSLYSELKNRLGSNDNVSSIITIRSEEGTSSSSIQRDSFNKLVNNTEVLYNGEKIVINQTNYKKYAIKQEIGGQGQGNETWSGFLFVSIRGGQQDTIETHSGKELTLFNPACEYASSDVSEDINLVLGYYALVSIDCEKLKEINKDKWREVKFLIKDVEDMLKTINYDFEKYKGNLFDFVKIQYCVSLIDGQLTDPIQLKRIEIGDFNIKDRKENSIDVTHQEAVIYEKYYWDKEKKCILSAARPTNLFWSFHLSNMMQQNYNLDDYFKYEEDRFKLRQKYIKNKKRG